MMKQIVFKKVMVMDRLPSVSDSYDTDYGRLEFDIEQKRWYDLDDNISMPFWFLEEIELPSDEDICNEGFDNSMCSISFSKGANYILNKLK